MSERWNGDRESKAKELDCRKAASAFISRRMDGIYRKDKEVIDTLTKEVKELFDPESTTRDKFSDKFIETIRKA